MDLNQVTVSATDLAVSIPFYQQLGLRLIVDASPRYARFECPDGVGTFSLHRTGKMPASFSTTVYFECKDLDDRVDRLVKKGVVFDLLPTDQSWNWREAHLSDPDGNPLILFFAGKDRLNPPWRVDPADGKL